jgi:rhomboid protease GluP
MQAADDDWRVVFESRSPAACREQALVLAARSVPHRIIHDRTGSALLVTAADSARAVAELRQYASENPPQEPKPARRIEWHDARPGVAAYVALLCLVAWLAGSAAFGSDWVAAGRVDGERIRDGEWWRLVTALTLHGDAAHLAGNLGFGSLFGFFAGRLLGSGAAWLTILVAAAAGNLVNTLLLADTHRSIGASTAVFAALGLVAGYVWRARLMSQEKWVYRLGPVVGGIALLAYTGMGGGETAANVDVGAHVTGFAAGFIAGMLLVGRTARLGAARLQAALGAAALGIVAAAWLIGLVASRELAIM